MAREKHKRRKPRGESTEAEHWGGPIRISDEGPVMGLERRDRVRRSYGRNNWKQEDAGSYDRQTVQYYEEASVRGLTKRSNPMRARLAWMVRQSSSLIQTCGAISTSFGTE